MEKFTGKRFIAYIIDFIIISFIAALFSNIRVLNPTMDEYEEAYESYLDMASEMSSSESVLEDINELSYDLTKYGMPSTIINMVVTVLYFVLFQYLNKGQTVGKALMKIRIISTKKEKLGIMQVLARSLIIHSIFVSLVSIILFYVLSENSFVVTISYVQLLDMTLLFTSVGMMLFRVDGRGLHDIVANTNVVSALEVDSKTKEVKYKEKK